MTASPISDKALDGACAVVFRSWLRFVPEAEARAQADAFRRRCAAIAADGHLTEAELDATLEIVSDSMSEDA